MHIPRDSDVVFVEYSVNDPQAPNPPFQNDMRRGMERLLRRLLTYPRRPAVILMHAYMWHKWVHADEMHDEVPFLETHVTVLSLYSWLLRASTGAPHLGVLMHTVKACTLLASTSLSILSRMLLL